MHVLVWLLPEHYSELVQGRTMSIRVFASVLLLFLAPIPAVASLSICKDVEGRTTYLSGRQEGCRFIPTDPGDRWSLLSQDDESEAYWIPSSIQKVSAHNRRVWLLVNFETVQWDYRSGKAFRSSKALHEFDCSFHRLRVVEVVFYAEEVGRGEVTSSGKNSTVDFDEAIPETRGENWLTAVCAEKIKQR
jgi:hypothetical protein